MAGMQTATTACEVEIVTPEGIRLLFDTSQALSDMLAVQTHMDLSEAAGSFSLTFAPRLIEGRTYDQLIPLRSLVTIRMEAPMGQLSKEDATVMVGLTEDHGVQEDFSRAQPQRLVTITGRSMALVFLDMQLRFFPGIADTQEGTLTIEDQIFNLFIPTTLIREFIDPMEALRTVLSYFIGLSNRVPLPPLEQHRAVQMGTQAQQAQQPDRTTQSIRQEQVKKAQSRPAAVQAGQTGQRPQATGDLVGFQQRQALIDKKLRENPGMSRPEAGLAVADELNGTPATTPVSQKPAPSATRSMAVAQAQQGQQPAQTMPQATREGVVRQHNILLNLQLPGRSLADLLDMNDDAWTMFDEEVRVNVGPQNTPYALTLWHYLHQFVDTTFQEFFTRVEGGIIKIHFRAKPFEGKAATTGSRFRTNAPTMQTFTYSRAAWEQIYLGSHLRRQTQNVYNSFLVLPMLVSTGLNDKGYEMKFHPVFLAKPSDPSYLLKYGIRLLHDSTPYLSAKQPDASNPTEHQQDLLIQRAHEWGQLAAAMYGLGPEMYYGGITVRGSPHWNIGHRLLYRDERGDREFYVEGVDHLYDFRTGRYITNLRVTRGWYIDGLVDTRETMGGAFGLQTEEVLADVH